MRQNGHSLGTLSGGRHEGALMPNIDRPVTLRTRDEPNQSPLARCPDDRSKASCGRSAG
jgi:hypothetical protein